MSHSMSDHGGEGHNSKVGGIAADQLQSILARVDRLEDEKKALSDDIKLIFDEAKAGGWDVKILRQLRRLQKMEPNERQEQDHLLDLYRNAAGI